ncbi:hypothetical protein SELMODRAFT_80505 [Selaginella moellendorffii]|nr:hypothetical protein SELMODRAFT_80505 [Selaginella moellendorffii]
MPEHVAIIMDGNSRWAKLRGLATDRGHEAGVHALREIVAASSRLGIKILTVFAFSTENWRRPTIEIQFLMQLFERVISEDSMNIFTKGICVHFIGDLSRLPGTLRLLACQIQERTRHNKGLKLVVGLSYSGRQDLVQACKAVAAEVQRGSVDLDEIDESKLESKLLTTWDEEISDPDLLIRTSGEKRLSNFMLWQLAYTELVFVPELWPDFGENEYRVALAEYQERDRRFGRHQNK